MHRISGNANSPAPHTEPDYVQDVEVFDNLGYEDIHRGVMALDPAVLTAGRQAWHTSGIGLADEVQQAHTEIRSAMADGWRGRSATMASGAVAAFEQLGQHVSDVMVEVARRLGEASDAAETLRAAVTHPAADHPDLQAALLDPKQAATNVTVQKQVEGARQDVVRVMNSVYAGVFVPTGDGVPAFPEGGMYPPDQPPAPAPAPQAAAPNPNAGNVVAPGAVTVSNQGPAVSAPHVAQPDSGHPAAPGQQSPADRPAAVAPGPLPGVAPTTVAGVGAPTAAAAVPAAEIQPVVEAPASAPAAAPQGTGTVPAVTGPGPVQAVSAAVSTKPSGTSSSTGSSADDDRRKRDDQDQGNGAGVDATGGMGAGIVGGLAGGAFAAGDMSRSGGSIPKPVRRPADDEDDDYYLDFDEPTFLEPSETGGELVGHMNPTTPPVLGEWPEEA